MNRTRINEAIPLLIAALTLAACGFASRRAPTPDAAATEAALMTKLVATMTARASSAQTALTPGPSPTPSAVLSTAAVAPTPTASVATPAAASVGELELVGQFGGLLYAVTVDRDRAYIGIGPWLAILDVSDPASPTRLG